MNRFNLTFSGEILTGYNLADVKRDFGKLFAIDDPERLEDCFSGQTVVIRRNLERKDAADYFHQLNLLGAVAALVKVNDDEAEAANSAEQPVAARAKPTANGEEKEVLTRIADLDPNAQVWAVSSRRTGKTQPSGKQQARTAARDPGGKSAGDLTTRIKDRLKETHRQAREIAKAEAEQSALQQQVAEEKARQAEEAARREAEEAATLRAELEEKARREAEETAKLKAEREEKARRETEEAERRRAKREEQQRREAETAAELKAELEEKARRETEEAARRETEEAERRRAKREEQQRREAEAAAKLKNEREEKARRETEEAARREAEEAERRRAEREEQQRREAEETARLKGEREEKARREAEETARLKAEREAEAAARLKAEREAEEAERRRAEREEQQRREAEEAARLKGEREEKSRREAEAAGRRRAEEEFRQLEAKEAARLEAELEEIKRQEEAEAQRVRAEARRRQLEAEQNFTARLRAARSELQLEPLPEEPPDAVALSGDINALRRSTRDAEGRLPPLIKKRQPGEPNLYTLRPFRNTREVRSRCEQARRLKKRFYALGVFGLVMTLITAQWFFQSPPEPPSTGVSAVASDNGSALVLLSGQSLLLHDRAGVASGEMPLEALGLLSLSAPLAFDAEGSLVAPGVLAGTAGETGAGTWQLLRCNLGDSSCTALAPELEAGVDSFVVNSIDGSIITAGDGGLVKLSAEGKVIVSAEVNLPKRPQLRLHAGLLLVNSKEGPGISVYRYENAAFGKQLDEILLLPPAAVEADHSRVGDFIRSGGAWWASLYNPKTGDHGLYRFDDEWNSLGEVRLPFSSGPIQLANWGEKTLVNDLRNNALQRYNAAGQAETPFLSASLEDKVAYQRRRANLTELAWRGGLLLAVLLTLLGLGTGVLQSLRQRVYKPHRERGAAPVDEESYLIQWIEPVPNRPALLRYRSLSYGLLSAGLLLLGVAASVSVWQLAALMLALAGPAVALTLLARQPIGHIGILGNRLLLVDHSGMYHIAGGSGIQHRGPYLLIDDVVVFSGNVLFPAFQSSEVPELLQPLTAAGVKVDRKTVMVKLLQGRHPLALGACAILLCAAAAAILLSLQGIF